MPSFEEYYASVYGGLPSYDPYRITAASLSFTVDPPKPSKLSPKFKTGERVNVKIDSAATVSYATSSGKVNVTLADGTHLTNIPVKHVTLADPEGWDTLTGGQVWKASGKLYGVRNSGLYGMVIYPVDNSGNCYYQKNADLSLSFDDFKTLRPTLVG